MVYPVAVKRGGPKIEGGHLGIGHLDAFRVGAAVEAALDGEAGAGGGAGDQLDDHLGWVSRGLPLQFWVMKANSRCSIRFHLTRLFGLRPLVPVEDGVFAVLA